MIEDQGAAIHGSLVERASDQKFFFKRPFYLDRGKNDILRVISCFRDC